MGKSWDATAWDGCLKAGRALPGGNIAVLDLSGISLILSCCISQMLSVYFSDIFIVFSKKLLCVFL